MIQLSEYNPTLTHVRTIYKKRLHESKLKALKLQEMSKYWNLKENEMSYKLSFVSNDNHLQNILGKI